MKKRIKEAVYNKIDIKKYNVSFDKRGNLFSVEASDLRGMEGGKKYILYNPKTGGEMEFYFDGLDKYGSAEDEEIAGWRYKSKDGKYHFLIIND